MKARTVATPAPSGWGHRSGTVILAVRCIPRVVPPSGGLLCLPCPAGPADGSARSAAGCEACMGLWASINGRCSPPRGARGRPPHGCGRAPSTRGRAAHATGGGIIGRPAGGRVRHRAGRSRRSRHPARHRRGDPLRRPAASRPRYRGAVAMGHAGVLEVVGIGAARRCTATTSTCGSRTPARGHRRPPTTCQNGTMWRQTRPAGGLPREPDALDALVPDARMTWSPAGHAHGGGLPVTEGGWDPGPRGGRPEELLAALAENFLDREMCLVDMRSDPIELPDSSVSWCPTRSLRGDARGQLSNSGTTSGRKESGSRRGRPGACRRTCTSARRRCRFRRPGASGSPPATSSSTGPHGPGAGWGGTHDATWRGRAPRAARGGSAG